ncbi:hypothetical protein TrLO_g9104 [Triparma laevis f. longispina]|uniref:Cleavage and polyadenylation specificity factor subunit 2 n=1 Tax=Triparma laevis f. longispina TaxID=1714387 RepID=A0A9W7EFP4_9STRA|nr:hypothetical protein TrLO_g9104 [Triparma laevis f. longispina]
MTSVTVTPLYGPSYFSHSSNSSLESETSSIPRSTFIQYNNPSPTLPSENNNNNNNNTANETENLPDTIGILMDCGSCYIEGNTRRRKKSSVNDDNKNENEEEEEEDVINNNLNSIKKILNLILQNKLHLIILTSSSLSSLGGLPLLYHHYTLATASNPTTTKPPFPPLLSTRCTKKLGHLNAYTLFISQTSYGPFTSYPLSSIDAIFSSLKWNEVKFSQPFSLLTSVSITPRPAGGNLGDAYYVLETKGPYSKTIYCPVYSHRDSRLVSKSALVDGEGSTDLVITYPGGTGSGIREGGLDVSWLYKQKKLKVRPVVSTTKELTETVSKILRRGGNVLLPFDEVCNSMIEVLSILNTWIRKSNLSKVYKVIWYCTLGKEVQRFVKTFLEYSKVGSSFDENGKNLLQFDDVKLVTSFEAIESMEGVILITDGGNCSSGGAGEGLCSWAGKEDNGIVYCELGDNFRDGPRRTLLKEWCKAKKEGGDMPDEVEVKAVRKERRGLTEKETEEFKEQEEQRVKGLREEEERERVGKQVEVVRKMMGVQAGTEEENNNPNVEEDKMDVEGEEGAEEGEEKKKSGALKKSSQPTSKSSKFDSTLFVKFSKPQHITAPVYEESICGVGKPDKGVKLLNDFRIITDDEDGNAKEKADDYGVPVDPDSFMDLVSGVVRKGGKIADEALKMGYLHLDTKTKEEYREKNFWGKLRDGEDVEKVDKRKIEEERRREEKNMEVNDLSEGGGVIKGREGRPDMKVIAETSELEVLAEVHYIPLQIGCDAEAGRYTMAAVRPRQMIILGTGNGEAGEGEDEVALLRKKVQPSTTNGDSVYAPKLDESTTCTIGTSSYNVRIVDEETEAEVVNSLASNKTKKLVEAQMGTYKVSLVDAQMNGKIVKESGALVYAPRAMDDSVGSSVMLSRGDVLLTDLRAQFLTRHMKADYAVEKDGGQRLVVNGKIVVKRDKRGDLKVEGPLVEDFFKVRAVVYEQFVML